MFLMKTASSVLVIKSNRGTVSQKTRCVSILKGDSFKAMSAAFISRGGGEEQKWQRQAKTFEVKTVCRTAVFHTTSEKVQFGTYP